jgi:RNA polymerase sigma factor (TIGR02999 family)
VTIAVTPLPTRAPFTVRTPRIPGRRVRERGSALTPARRRLRLLRAQSRQQPAAMSPTSHEVTELLAAIAEGRSEARDTLFGIVYDELKRVAAAQLRRERHEQTLGATALVHETWLRLSQQQSLGQHGRGHFFGIAAQAMRRILVEQARRRRAVKRSRDMAVTLEPDAAAGDTSASDEVLAVHDALDRLALIDARQAQLVEYRYFAGYTIEEAAELLDISPATAKRDWTLARAWLHRELAAAE